MDSQELVESVTCELFAGRPAKALSILRTFDPAEDPADLLELRFRTYLAVGHADDVLHLVEEMQGDPAAVLSEPVRQLYRGLAMWCLEENPRARALELLAPLPDSLEGEHAALCLRALAQLYLECGAPELAKAALARGRAADPGAEDHGAVDLLMALLCGDRVAADVAARGRGLGARDRTRYAAATGDWTSVDIEIETLREVFLDDPEGLGELATMAELTGDHAGAREALLGFERAFPAMGDGAQRRYRIALAELRIGKVDEGVARLEVLARGEGLVPDAARALLAMLEGPDREGESVAVSGMPYVEWPGVYSAAGALCLALWRQEIHLKPFEVQDRLQVEGGDVVSSHELLDLLRDEGIPFARFEADRGSLLRVLRADLPVLLRLVLPGRGPGWGLLVGYDAVLDLYRIHFPRFAYTLELPVAVVESLQAPMANAALVVAGRGEVRRLLDLKLKSSMALEALDQAARLARQGKVSEATERLTRAKGYRERFLPLWRLLVELQVVAALTDPAVDEDAAARLLEEAKATWPEEPWPRLFRARLLLEARADRDAALACLEQAVVEVRPSAEVFTEIGDLLEERGDLEGAAESWWLALGTDALHARPREQLSRHLRRKGELAGALAFCETARESSPKNPYNWEMRGILLAELGAPEEEVEAALRHAVDLAPGRPYAYGFLADSLQRAGRLEEAIELLEEAAVRVGDPFPFLVRLAEVHFDLEDFPRTIEAAERALEAAEEPGGDLRPGGAVPLALIGAAHGRSGMLEDALEYLARAIAADPEDPWPVREAAIHLRNRGDTTRALEILDGGRARIPDDVGIRAQRALTLEVEGDLARALDAAREALELAGPDDVEVVRLVARLAHDAGEAVAADAVWRASIASAANPLAVRKQFLSFLLDVEAFAVAEKEGQIALAEAPEDEELCAWYGFALLRLGRGGDSIPWLRRALKIAPEFVFARSILLDALTEEGEEAQAIEVYEASRGLFTPLGYECAFVAFARLGRHERALQVARKACMAVPHAEGFFRRRAARLLLDDLCEYPEALREATAAVEAAPDDFRNHEVLAWAYVSVDDFEAAEAAMDRMVMTGASEEDLYRFRRYLAARRGDLACEEACAAHLGSIARDPRTAASWWVDAAARCLGRGGSDDEARAYLARGDLLPHEWATAAARAAAAGRGDLARDLLGRAGEGGGPEAHLARGELAAAGGDLEGALACFTELADRHPGDHRGPEYRARALFALGRIEEAREPAAKAFEMARAYCESANFVYGVTLLLAGDVNGSLAHFRRAAALAGGGPLELLHVMALWAEGHPGEAGAVLAELEARGGIGALDAPLVAPLVAAAGLVG